MGINVLAQRHRYREFYLFAELEIKSFPNYCYVFHTVNKIFTFSLLTSEQKTKLINTDFYDKSTSPVALSRYITKGFRKGMKICWQLHLEITKYLNEHPVDFEAMDNTVIKYGKKLEKYFEKITLADDLFSLFNELEDLNKVMIAGIDKVLFGALDAFDVAATGKSWSKHYNLRDMRVLSEDIHLGPLIIFPKGNTSILFLKIKEAARSSMEFKYLETFYLLTRKFYKLLNDPKSYLIELTADLSASKPPCPICNNSGICLKCGGVGEIEGEKDDLILCPNCKGLGSCDCERA